MADEFYVAGFPTEVEGREDGGIAVGQLALTLEGLRDQREADEATVRDFEFESGQKVTVFKLVPVGRIWEV